MTTRRHFTKKWRENLSNSLKGRIPSNKGIPWSLELRKKHEKTRKSLSYRKKMSLCKIGKKNPMFGIINEKHHNWKGKNVSYSGLHKWVFKELGRPKKCCICKKSKQYIDWANKSRQYKRVLDDWMAVCRSCHRKHDGFIFNKKIKNYV